MIDLDNWILLHSYTVFLLVYVEVNQLSDLFLQVLADSHQAQVCGQPLRRLTQSFKELYHPRLLSTKSTQRVQNIVDPCLNASCFIFTILQQFGWLSNLST